MYMKYCPGCGREVRAGANFCGKCGHRLNSRSQQDAAPGKTDPGAGKSTEKNTARPVKKKKHGKWFVTILLILIVMSGALYFSPFWKFTDRFAGNPAPETGMNSTDYDNPANSDFSSIQINVAHRNGKSPSPGPGSDEIDDEILNRDKIDKATSNIEQALLSGDQARLREVMTDNAIANYGKDLTLINSDELVKFGEAFKSREMKIFSSLYTEYAIKLDGKEFIVSVARQSDGSWKIMRF